MPRRGLRGAASRCLACAGDRLGGQAPATAEPPALPDGGPTHCGPDAPTAPPDRRSILSSVSRKALYAGPARLCRRATVLSSAVLAGAAPAPAPSATKHGEHQKLACDAGPARRDAQPPRPGPAIKVYKWKGRQRHRPFPPTSRRPQGTQFDNVQAKGAATFTAAADEAAATEAAKAGDAHGAGGGDPPAARIQPVQDRSPAPAPAGGQQRAQHHGRWQTVPMTKEMRAAELNVARLAGAELLRRRQPAGQLTGRAMLRQQGRAVLWIVPVLALAAALATGGTSRRTPCPCISPRRAPVAAPRRGATGAPQWRDAQGSCIRPTCRPRTALTRRSATGPS